MTFKSLGTGRIEKFPVIPFNSFRVFLLYIVGSIWNGKRQSNSTNSSCDEAS